MPGIGGGLLWAVATCLWCRAALPFDGLPPRLQVNVSAGALAPGWTPARGPGGWILSVTQEGWLPGHCHPDSPVSALCVAPQHSRSH